MDLSNSLVQQTSIDSLAEHLVQAVPLVVDCDRAVVTLIDTPGVAGIWWHHETAAGEAFGAASQDRQITYCYLDDDPVAVAALLGEQLQGRWAAGAVQGLLAAPFYAITPFDWGRRLPA